MVSARCMMKTDLSKPVADKPRWRRIRASGCVWAERSAQKLLETLFCSVTLLGGLGTGRQETLQISSAARPHFVRRPAVVAIVAQVPGQRLVSFRTGSQAR
jgi:hypothetical protein